MLTKAERKRALRTERRKRGLCQDCGKPAVPGLSNCEKHRIARRNASKKQKEKRFNEGRCTRCGRVLDSGMLSKSKYVCLVCQEKQHIARIIRGR